MKLNYKLDEGENKSGLKDQYPYIEDKSQQYDSERRQNLKRK